MSSILSTATDVVDTVVGGVTDFIDGAVDTVTGSLTGDNTVHGVDTEEMSAVNTPALAPAPVASAAAAELAPAKEPVIAPPEPTPEPNEVAKPKEFAVREQRNQQRAAAAGSLRSANDADLLGYTTPKKRGASRALLG